jgi:hypothetical protein
MTTEDGSQTATADVAEYFLRHLEPSALYITNLTGVLAPLNRMIAVLLHEEQPNGDVVARLFLNGNVLAIMMVVVLMLMM